MSIGGTSQTLSFSNRRRVSRWTFSLEMRSNTERLTLGLVAMVTVAWSVVGQAKWKREFCDRSPPETDVEKTPGDNGFRIKIAGRPQPEAYAPEQVYTVSISGTYPKQTFTSFYLVAVPENAADESTALGSFQHLDQTMTKFSEDCFFVVVNTNTELKTEVEVLWTAPGKGTGCIEFRATVVESKNLWYKDDGALSRTFCEDTASTDGVHSLEMLPDCCACGTAKYQMTFEGLWSTQTHPKDFPKDHRLLHWSHIVGASHSKHYAIWQLGSVASKAVHEICELGQPQTLETEMRKHSQDIRTVIKTPKIQWSESLGLRQLRWAHFSVDRKNHLLSIITRPAPSPDWCVGVSALNLCLSNCSWSGHVTVDLYPWDAGTDDALSYTSLKQRSDSPSKIQRLTNTFPVSPLSPFYGPESIRPMAQLKLKRISPKPDEVFACVDPQLPFSRDDDTSPAAAAQPPPPPPVDLAESHRDAASTATADARTRPSGTFGVVGGCTTPWSPWSDCSVSCGQGVRSRRRSVLSLHSTDSCGEATVITELCQGNGSSDCSQPVAESSSSSCPVTQWSSWSECKTICSPSSSSANPSMKTRHRFHLDSGARCDEKTPTEQKESCHAPPPTPWECHQSRNESSSSLLTGVCDLPPDRGPCLGRFLRWHYDPANHRCRSFDYGGCLGNDNRFWTQQECYITCHRPPQSSTNGSAAEQHVTPDETQISTNQLTENIHSTATPSSTIDTAFSRRSHAPVFFLLHSSTISPPSPPRRCLMSEWTEWSACSSTCGSNAFRTRTRTRSAQAKPKCSTKKRHQKQSCKDLPKCPSSSAARCRLSAWTEWTECSKTMTNCDRRPMIQERQRHVLSSHNNNNDDDDDDLSCITQLNRRLCPPAPCSTSPSQTKRHFTSNDRKR